MKLALVAPKIKVADTSFNTEEIIKTYKEASANGADIVAYPELTVTGATCGDLFLHSQLYNSNTIAIKKITEATKEIASTIIFGSYLEIENDYYDCIFIAESGILKGIVPKVKAVDFGGIDFGRWFSDGIDILDLDTVETGIFDYSVAFGDDLIFDNTEYGIDLIVKNGSDVFFNDAEIDLEVPGGETNPLLVINTTADSTQVGHINYRKEYYKNKSSEHNCFYAYVSPGVYESTTDFVFSGQAFAAGYGEIISDSRNFERESSITYADMDRANFNNTYKPNATPFSYKEFKEGMIENISNPLPFIPQDKFKLDEICKDAFAIQANALATRFEHTRSEKAVIGISGGLDSTLALLAAVETFRILGKSTSDIITITMPGFGTSDRTFENAVSLMKLLGTDLREISIVDSVNLHLKEIEHDKSNKNTAYENAQARERTQILMDLANDVNGMVIGTGDLSESALGWCTYGGDHLAMYGTNASIPKTLIPYILNWVAENKHEYTDDADKLQKTLKSVIETPISPELLPADEKGEIAQKTEDSVGPYELHDYFIYHTMLNRMSPTELLNNAEKAFSKAYDRDTIKKWLTLFYRRFFSQQFKRNCSTEAPMVTHISLSPRGGLVMPSDAVVNEWIKSLD